MFKRTGGQEVFIDLFRVAQGWKICDIFPETFQKFLEDSKKYWNDSKVSGMFLKFTGRFSPVCSPRPGIAWLLVEGSKTSFISWSKLKIKWLGKQYAQIMCSSGIPNKLIGLEKILSLQQHALCSLRSLVLTTENTGISSAKYFKTCFFRELNNGANTNNLK